MKSPWSAVGFGPRVAWRSPGTSWRHLYGAAMLCGIGFTMSLFIGALAYPGEPALTDQAKLGTLAGSLLSALAGFAMLRFAPAATEAEGDREDAAELFAADQP